MANNTFVPSRKVVGANPLKISGIMVGRAQGVQVPLAQREVILHFYQIQTIRRDKKLFLGTFQITAKSLLLNNT